MQVVLADYVASFPMGILPQERTTTQRLKIQVVVDCADPGRVAEQLQATYDYAPILQTLAQLQGERLDLLETLCERVAEVAFANPLPWRVTVRVDKLDLLPGDAVIGLTRVLHRCNGAFEGAASSSSSTSQQPLPSAN